MLAFTNTKVTKQELLIQLHGHYMADEIVKGRYWHHGKGCAVGCSTHSSDHSLYEELFGIPEALARLEDAIFEGLPNEQAKEFPLQFVEAITPGRDLTGVAWQFTAWVLADPVAGGIRFAGNAEWGVAAAVQTVADLCARMATGDPIPPVEWDAACAAAAAAAAAATAAAAAAAARDARAAAAAAADAACAARDASAAACAGRAAGRVASRAAYASAYASAYAAAADAACVAQGVADAAFASMRDKLLELLANA